MAPQQSRKNGGASCGKIKRSQPTSLNFFAPDVQGIPIKTYITTVPVHRSLDETQESL